MADEFVTNEPELAGERALPNGVELLRDLRRWLLEFLPLAAAGVVLAGHRLLANTQIPSPDDSYVLLLQLLFALLLAIFIVSYPFPDLRRRVRESAPLLAASLLLLALWELITLKLGLLPLPYFPGPDRVVAALHEDWLLLGKSAFYSLRLLATGYLLGVALGLVSGILMGWSKGWHYWISPLMKVIGPVPATAWIPLAMIVFPTSFWASVFLVALAVWFPVTVMTGSGIANVRNAFFEVARTLGASERRLIFRVALPAAFPTIFIGLFMGLGASFLVLIVAEMIGVKAGLGWYIGWAQGWAEYAKVYACLALIAMIFSTIIAFLFQIRDRVLIWQKGVIKW
jgi:NitT/TauT family transport system permease protein